MNARLLLAALLASLVLLPACGGTPFAPSPSPQPGSGGAPPVPQPAPSPEPEPPQLQPAATLAIEQLTVAEFPPTTDRDRNGLFIHNYYSYLVKFLLRETSGRSAALVRDVFVGKTSGEGENIGPQCMGDGIRVPPGGTVYDFYTDELVRGWSWCYPAPSSSGPLEQLRVIVTFTDDSGVIGRVSADVMTRK